MSERTPEEREAARRERERRRALRSGRPLPAEAEAAPVATARHDPHATQQFDVTGAWEQEGARPAVEEPAPPAVESPGEDLPETERPAELRSWAQEHGEGAPPLAEPPEAPRDRTDEHEVPLGIRRVSAHERLAQKRPHLHRPHLPRRRAAGPGTGAPRVSRSRGARVAAAIVIVLVLAAGWFLISLFQPFTGSGSGRVVVRVPAGAGASQIGDLLEREGVISSSFFFRLRATLDGVRGDLRSGTFTLRHGMSYGAALDALTHVPPPPPIVKVTIPEGRSRREAAALVAQDGLRGSYRAATRRSHLLNPRHYGAPRRATLEGFLFPATYDLRPHASVDVLVAKQLAAFKDALARVDLRAARRHNLTPFDVVTIASMVEREVAVPKERPLVAAVIWNRLRLGMPLGIDATLRFALNDWDKPLTESQLRNPTPYNLRLHHGLPPGPIGNPGLASLQAAAHPAHVGYLFYVVKPGTCGEHAFSSTDAQFQRDVARYNAARAAAGGKSPTKC
jgi:peptidoglycan lytic transglycosylase G